MVPVPLPSVPPPPAPLPYQIPCLPSCRMQQEARNKQVSTLIKLLNDNQALSSTAHTLTRQRGCNGSKTPPSAEKTQAPGMEALG